jgi:hypothetical protein
MAASGTRRGLSSAPPWTCRSKDDFATLTFAYHEALGFEGVQVLVDRVATHAEQASKIQGAQAGPLMQLVEDCLASLSDRCTSLHEAELATLLGASANALLRDTRGSETELWHLRLDLPDLRSQKIRERMAHVLSIGNPYFLLVINLPLVISLLSTAVCVNPEGLLGQVGGSIVRGRHLLPTCRGIGPPSQYGGTIVGGDRDLLLDL